MFIPLNSTDSGQTVNYSRDGFGLFEAHAHHHAVDQQDAATQRPHQRRLGADGLPVVRQSGARHHRADRELGAARDSTTAWRSIATGRMAVHGNPFVIQGGNDPPTGTIKSDRNRRRWPKSSIPTSNTPRPASWPWPARARRTPAPREFFIMEEPARFLDFNYTIFGFQTTGTSVINDDCGHARRKRLKTPTALDTCQRP